MSEMDFSSSGSKSTLRYVKSVGISHFCHFTVNPFPATFQYTRTGLRLSRDRLQCRDRSETEFKNRTEQTSDRLHSAIEDSPIEL